MENDGKNYVRVSEVLGFFKDLSSIPEEILERKCQIGIDVHAAIEKSFSDEFYPIEDAGLGYLDSFESWKSANLDEGWEFVETEVRLFDDDTAMTGAFDCLGKIKGEKGFHLIDFKTSYAVDNIFWPLQGTFYRNLALKNGVDVSDTIYFIKLDRKGNPPKICVYVVTDELEEICESMRKIYFHLTKVNYLDKLET